MKTSRCSAGIVGRFARGTAVSGDVARARSSASMKSPYAAGAIAERELAICTSVSQERLRSAHVSIMQPACRPRCWRISRQLVAPPAFSRNVGEPRHSGGGDHVACFSRCTRVRSAPHKRQRPLRPSIQRGRVHSDFGAGGNSVAAAVGHRQGRWPAPLQSRRARSPLPVRSSRATL